MMCITAWMHTIADVLDQVIVLIDWRSEQRALAHRLPSLEGEGMATFTVRMVLHKATWVDYTQLAAEMAEEGFVSTPALQIGRRR